MNPQSEFLAQTPRWQSRALAALLIVGALALAASRETQSQPAEQVARPKTMRGARAGCPGLLGDAARRFEALPSGSVQGPRGEDEQAVTLDEALRQAETELTGGRFKEALEKCQQAVKLEPQSAHAYYLLGMVQSRLGNQEEAKQALLRASKLDPSDIASHVYLGEIYLAAKELVDAATEFEAAIKLHDASGSGHYGLALVMLANSRYADALPHLLAAVQANPDDPERILTLIAVELALKKVDQARKNVSRIEYLSIRNPWLSYRLGELLLEHGMENEAEVEFERAAARLEEPKDGPFPQDAKISDLYLHISRLRFARHDYPGTLQSLVKVEPASLEADLQAPRLHLEGAALLGLWRVQEAREKLERAVQLNPSEPDYFSHLIWVELLAGDVKAATASAEIAQGKWPLVPKVQQLLALVAREQFPARAGVPFAENWHLKGEGVVCCPCSVPCPCRSNAPSTRGHCENAGVFRIAQGHYGKIPLEGLTFAIVSGSMGPESTLPTALYTVESATDEQLIALERIFQSFDLLHPFMFLKVKRTAILFNKSANGDTYEIKVPGVLQIVVRRQTNGRPLSRTAALDYFSNTIEYAQNVTYKAWDEDGSLRWDFSGQQANLRTIGVDSRDYRDGTMLIQFADGSGFFTKKQLELIKNLKLPTLPSYPRPRKQDIVTQRGAFTSR